MHQLEKDKNGRLHLKYDWCKGGIPRNVKLGDNMYINTSKGFERVSEIPECSIQIGNQVGFYDQFNLEVGDQGFLKIGDYSMINSARIRCVLSITIGNYNMISWGTYITDSWPDFSVDRKQILLDQILQPEKLVSLSIPKPVILEDNVWVGFGCVIMPGVTIGEGAVVASKTVVKTNIEPYTVVGGSPMRVIKRL